MELWEQYRKDCLATRMSVRGAERVVALRAALDSDGQDNRRVVVSADGSYTNTAMMATLPDRTTFIGRLRKDAKLYALPEPNPGRGRRRIHGHAMPTPEQIRQGDTVPWRQVQVYLAGQRITVECKEVGPLRWRATRGRDLRLVIIRPLAYRPAKGQPLWTTVIPSTSSAPIRNCPWRGWCRLIYGAGRSRSASATRRRSLAADKLRCGRYPAWRGFRP